MSLFRPSETLFLPLKRKIHPHLNILNLYILNFKTVIQSFELPLPIRKLYEDTSFPCYLEDAESLNCPTVRHEDIDPHVYAVMIC